MFAWRYLDGRGTETGESEVFGTRAEAETWLATAWGALRDGEVVAVELIDRRNAVAVYRMSLEEE
jgi:hypothetical protein